MGKSGGKSVLLEILREHYEIYRYDGRQIRRKRTRILPSDFRKQLAESDATFVLKRDVYQPCLVMYTLQVWENELAVLQSRLDRWNPKHAMLYRQFMAGTEVVTLDANGRFLLPRKWLRLVTSTVA